MSRDLWLKLRVTAEEKTAFEFAAAENGLNLSDFIRQRLMAGQLRRTAEERETVRHLASLGADLNQLARWANTHKSHAEALELILCLDQLKDDLKTIGGTTYIKIFPHGKAAARSRSTICSGGTIPAA